jgi:hypothetical protein
MTGAIFLAGIFLILAGLWNRDQERLALILAAVGGILVVIAGILAIPALMPPAG